MRIFRSRIRTRLPKCLSKGLLPMRVRNGLNTEKSSTLHFIWRSLRFSKLVHLPLSIFLIPGIFLEPSDSLAASSFMDKSCRLPSLSRDRSFYGRDTPSTMMMIIVTDLTKTPSSSSHPVDPANISYEGWMTADRSFIKRDNEIRSK